MQSKLSFFLLLFCLIEHSWAQSCPVDQYCDEDNNELISQCVQSLCGPPEKLLSFMVNDSNFEQFVDPACVKKFDPIEDSVKEMLKVEIERDKKFLERYQSFVQDQKFQTMTLTQDLIELLAMKFFNLRFVQIKDDNEIKLHRLKTEGLDPIMVAGLKAYALQAIKNRNNNISEMLTFLPEKAKQKLKEALAQVREARESDSPYLKRIIPELKAALSMIETMSSSELHSLAYKLEGYEEQISVLENKKNTAVTTNRCEHPDCQTAIRTYFSPTNLQKMFKELQEIYAQEHLLDQLFAKFKSYYMPFCFAASPVLREGFIKDVWPQVKNTFVDQSMKNLSAHSREKFKNFLETVTIIGMDSFLNLPGMSTEDFLDEVKRQVSESIKAASREGSQAAPFVQEISKFNFVNQLMSYQNEANEIGLREIKPRLIIDFMSDIDAFMTPEMAAVYAPHLKDPQNTVIASTMSMRYPEQGKFVLLHEVGHALSSQMSQGKLSTHSHAEYKKVRDCSKRFFTKPQPPPVNSDEYLKAFLHPGDSLTSEEDTADLYSYAGKVKGDPLFHECTMMNVTLDKKRFDPESLQMQLLPGATHSPEIIRLLREAFHSDVPLSESCQKVMEKIKDEYRFEKCI